MATTPLLSLPDKYTLLDFLNSIGMSSYHDALVDAGVSTPAELLEQVTCETFLKTAGMEKVVHRRKLLRQVSILRKRLQARAEKERQVAERLRRSTEAAAAAAAASAASAATPSNAASSQPGTPATASIAPEEMFEEAEAEQEEGTCEVQVVCVQFKWGRTGYYRCTLPSDVLRTRQAVVVDDENSGYDLGCVAWARPPKDSKLVPDFAVKRRATRQEVATWTGELARFEREVCEAVRANAAGTGLEVARVEYHFDMTNVSVHVATQVTHAAHVKVAECFPDTEVSYIFFSHGEAALNKQEFDATVRAKAESADENNQREENAATSLHLAAPEAAARPCHHVHADWSSSSCSDCGLSLSDDDEPSDLAGMGRTASQSDLRLSRLRRSPTHTPLLTPTGPPEGEFFELVVTEPAA